jgi:putative glutamine amidotransferase
MRPLVGITMERSSDADRLRPWRTGHPLDYLLCAYTALVESAGLQPVLLPVGLPGPSVHGLVRRLDGLLLSGGSDLDPGLWGESELEPGGFVVPLTEDERRRSRWEDALVKAALEVDLPLLGICRGMQQLNVSLGGSLWQDLERQTGRAGHLESEDPFRRVHALTADAAAGDWAELLDRSTVTSTHHQGLRAVAADLQVLARAAGEPEVVEAVRRSGPAFALGVQWHPERLPDDPLTRRLVDEFAAAILGRMP